VTEADIDLAILTALVDRIFSPAKCSAIECAEGGVSTPVYRIRRDREVFYLRVAEDRDSSLAPEVYVHEYLRALDVKVPSVVHFEPFDERLGRSIMVTTEIPGVPVGCREVDEATTEILREAGRDLAIINALPVLGFGWIRRDGRGVGHLRGEHDSHRAFVLEHIDEDLALLGQGLLAEAEIRLIRDIIDRYAGWLDVEQAWLAHGDFDVSHIYQRDGRYTGIIDFGEIRGADRLYDLAHFNLHDGESLPQTTLPFLLQGYGAGAHLPPDHEQRINLLSLLIGVRALSRNRRRRPPNTYQVYLASAIRQAIAFLKR
jgi:aminoglycoside phosphotransferase (APT) family kinase protein